jgi:hypothetical protein
LEIGSSELFAWGWLEQRSSWSMLPWLTRIRGMSHWHPACSPVFILLGLVPYFTSYSSFTNSHFWSIPSSGLWGGLCHPLIGIPVYLLDYLHCQLGALLSSRLAHPVVPAAQHGGTSLQFQHLGGRGRKLVNSRPA